MIRLRSKHSTLTDTGFRSRFRDGAADRTFFFFQAEDGIRDKLVTGVQTCALPISSSTAKGVVAVCDLTRYSTLKELDDWVRSEERRVGKSVDLGGRRIIKKKKNRKRECQKEEKQ